MTGAQIKAFFQTLVDDNTLSDSDQTLLMNAAKDAIESERDWEITKALDETKTTVAGATYLTSYDMPTDCLVPAEVYIGTETIPYIPIPMAQRSAYKDSGRHIYYDFANNHYYLTGTPTAGQTIHFNYLKSTADIADGTSPTWPTRFHQIIPYRMARMFYAIDGGDKSRAWDDRWSVYENTLWNSMVEWDTKLKLLSHTSEVIDPNNYSNIVA